MHEHVPAVGLHQPDDVLQRDALPGAAAPQEAERRAAPDVECHIVENLPIAERLGHMVQDDRWLTVPRVRVRGGFSRRDRLHHARSGNRKKINFTSTTLLMMMRIDAYTTLRVAVRPTPSVPWVVVKPRWDATVPMIIPKTTVFSVDGMKSWKLISENARRK